MGRWSGWAVALLGSATVLGCSDGLSSGPGDQGPGEVKLAFTTPGGLTIDQVTYTVHSSSNATLLTGTVDTSDANATASVDFALPPSTNDTVTLSATTTSGVSCSGTSSPFDIVAALPATVTMSLVCGGTPATPPGVVSVSASVVEGDNCPSIVSATAGPAQVSVGRTIAVTASAIDPDAADQVLYAWTPAGNFSSPTSPQTQFTCTSAGTFAITLVVSDDRQPSACASYVVMSVTCVACAAGGPC